ncbi:MarR family winged helix-turn-helix transcriptional regulator [Neorhizobium galegae]|uniref:MarR family winged helix-turn-helix transcriptional regulator n=1 Tax=Neorhizobium galegae TaxID=399 RepID=UPI0006215E9A|nr:MarR family winged helix-turn-helix transcriptional regulator [Neorhizobium galegae]CDZ27661.1 MarR family regulatory helix-turn-helix protein 17 [Neorhizobium galegae bv. officinalis]KAA9386655.1 winged helix-turn-helix transcriptional regulator [Neorhizobium galegae]KAB1109091.1 winged helix-turn-helix transcriptional regulator [Neorhizobium galegae]MCM2501455.1 MarR family winged helix-turn-helix transcriptional regulator [Neorhizobium galegae]MCQ1772406.1 MarR family winged helix-turn-h
MTDKDKQDKQGQTEDGIWLHCSNSAVRRASRHLGQLYEDAMGDTSLRGTQFSLMSQIARSNEPTLKNLAEAMVMDLSALGHTLKPLIRDGLVELVPDAQDRRAKRVRLTDMGAATQRDLTARWQIAQDRFDKAFGKEKSEELRRTLAFISSDEFAKAFNRND